MLTQTPIIAQYLGLLLLTLLIHASYRATKPYNFYLREGFANYIFGVFLFLVFLFPVFHASEQFAKILYPIYTVVGPLTLIAYFICIIERKPKFPPIPKANRKA